MSEQRFSYRPSELRHLSVECKNCKTKIILDLQEPARELEHCPGCGSQFEHLSRMLADYREFLRNSQSTGYDVRLETTPTPEPAALESPRRSR